LQLKLLGKEISNTNPLNYNIVYVANRLLKFVEEKLKTIKPIELYKEVLQEAKNIDNEEVYKCDRLSLNGLSLIKNGASILTYANSGILFTGGIGTGLGIIYKAYNRYNGNIKLYISESRPLFEGLKLTCWELSKTRTQFICLCDNTAGFLFSQKKIDMCITGVEKITKDGDVVAKIGTYNLAVLCKIHNIPFIVAFPTSSIDYESEQDIFNLINPRNQDEVFSAVFNGNNKVPKNYVALNYSYDVTPASYVSYYINEKGVYKDFKKMLADFKKNSKKEIKMATTNVKAIV
jgi:methylthioribose-1-phosphate isomerase